MRKVGGGGWWQPDLLQILPLFDAAPTGLVTIRLDDPSETLGVNTPEQALQAEAILAQRRQSSQP